MHYTVSIDATVLDNYSAAPGRDRSDFRKAVAALADDPYRRGDTRVQAQAGANTSDGDSAAG